MIQQGRGDRDAAGSRRACSAQLGAALCRMRPCEG